MRFTEFTVFLVSFEAIFSCNATNLIALEIQTQKSKPCLNDDESNQGYLLVDDLRRVQ